MGHQRCFKWCGRRDSNSHALRHWNLNPARLPISPLPQKTCWKIAKTQRFQGRGYSHRHSFVAISESKTVSSKTQIEPKNKRKIIIIYIFISSLYAFINLLYYFLAGNHWALLSVIFLSHIDLKTLYLLLDSPPTHWGILNSLSGI